MSRTSIRPPFLFRPCPYPANLPTPPTILRRLATSANISRFGPTTDAPYQQALDPVAALTDDPWPRRATFPVSLNDATASPRSVPDRATPRDPYFDEPHAPLDRHTRRDPYLTLARLGSPRPPRHIPHIARSPVSRPHGPSPIHVVFTSLLDTTRLSTCSFLFRIRYSSLFILRDLLSEPYAWYYPCFPC